MTSALGSLAKYLKDFSSCNDNCSRMKRSTNDSIICSKNCEDYFTLLRKTNSPSVPATFKNYDNFPEVKEKIIPKSEKALSIQLCKERCEINKDLMTHFSYSNCINLCENPLKRFFKFE